MGILPMNHRQDADATKPHGQDARDTHGRDAHATGKTASVTYPLFFLLALTLLLVAGTAFSAQPAARRPLPETAVLDRVDGRILRVDANDTWLFELSMEVKMPDYRLPVGTRLELLPSSALGRLIADANDRVAPLYRLSARVTQFQGRNFLLPTYYLPLSKFKDDRDPEDGGQKTEDSRTNPQSAIRSPQSNDPNLAVPPEILEQLKKQRPLGGPRRRPEPQTQPAPAALERMLVERVGRIEPTREPVPQGREAGDGTPHAPQTDWIFVPYALGWNLGEVRYGLLPCTALEQALHLQRQSLDPIRFNVAGLVTEFQGRKYLLLQRAIIVYNYGNFGR
jgi:hypothetical protein